MNDISTEMNYLQALRLLPADELAAVETAAHAVLVELTTDIGQELEDLGVTDFNALAERIGEGRIAPDDVRYIFMLASLGIGAIQASWMARVRREGGEP